MSAPEGPVTAMIKRIATGLTLLALTTGLTGCFGGSAPRLSESERRIQEMNERSLSSMEKQRFDDARTLLDEALRIASSLDDAERRALTLLNLARLERRLGHLPQAELLLDQAMKQGRSTSHSADLAQEMALLKLAMNKPDDALAWAEKAFKLEQGEMKGRRLNLLARIAMIQGRDQDALRLTQEALSHTKSPQMLEERANAMRVTAQIIARENRLEEAEKLLKEALEIDRSLERPAKIAADLQALAEVMRLRENTAGEKEYRQRAERVRENMR